MRQLTFMRITGRFIVRCIIMTDRIRHFHTKTIIHIRDLILFMSAILFSYKLIEIKFEDLINRRRLKKWKLYMINLRNKKIQVNVYSRYQIDMRIIYTVKYFTARNRSDMYINVSVPREWLIKTIWRYAFGSAAVVLPFDSVFISSYLAYVLTAYEKKLSCQPFLI